MLFTLAPPSWYIGWTGEDNGSLRIGSQVEQKRLQDISVFFASIL
jgi:hypothetical protein